MPAVIQVSIPSVPKAIARNCKFVMILPFNDQSSREVLEFTRLLGNFQWMSLFKKQTGDQGEELAVKYLRKLGYKILSRNLKNHLGEIDILAREKSDIVVIEVKTKSTSVFGEGYEMVNYFKKKKLLTLARELQKEYSGKTVRIDVVSVDLSKDKAEIKHFKNAVEDD